MDYLSCFEKLRELWPRFTGGFCRSISSDLAEIVQQQFPNYDVYLAYTDHQKRVPCWINHQIVVVDENGGGASALDAVTCRRNGEDEKCLVISTDNMDKLMAELKKYYQGEWELQRYQSR